MTKQTHRLKVILTIFKTKVWWRVRFRIWWMRHRVMKMSKLSLCIIRLARWKTSLDFNILLDLVLVRGKPKKKEPSNKNSNINKLLHSNKNKWNCSWPSNQKLWNPRWSKMRWTSSSSFLKWSQFPRYLRPKSKLLLRPYLPSARIRLSMPR